MEQNEGTTGGGPAEAKEPEAAEAAQDGAETGTGTDERPADAGGGENVGSTAAQPPQPTEG